MNDSTPTKMAVNLKHGYALSLLNGQQHIRRKSEGVDYNIEGIKLKLFPLF